MKKLFLKFSTVAWMFMGAVTATAQPTLTPIAAYKYQNTNNGYSKSILTGAVSHSTANVLDVAASQTHHFQCGTSSFTGTGTRIFIVKKDAVTGAHVAMNNANAGLLYGIAESQDECKGMLLDEAHNRVYVFGTMQSPGDIKRSIVICYNTTTLAVETSYGYGFGLQSINSTNFESEVIDMALTLQGRFLVLMNVKDANNKYYLSLAEIDMAGGWLSGGQISNPSYECYGARLKYIWDFGGNIFVAGKATNTSGQSIPMFWAINQNTYTIAGQTAAQFTNPLIGYGTFVDFGLYNWTTFVVVGNSTSNNGIWAKLTWNYGYDPNFKNGATIPGTQSGVVFRRCLVQPDGYTVTLNGPATTNGSLGYITPTGNSYVNQQSILFQHASGLNKDVNGNVIVGGCHSAFYSTAKFTSYNGSWPEFINRVPMEVPSETEEVEMTTFPNPVNNLLTLNYKGKTNGNEQIVITDISGKKVMEISNVSFDNQQTALDISNLSKGIYFVRLNANDKSTIQKIVKE